MPNKVGAAELKLMLYIGDWGEDSTQLHPIGKLVSVSFRVRVVRACVRSCVGACGSVPQRWRPERREVRLRRGLSVGAFR